MVQREGRILRRGNTSTRVDIFRYIAEGSFDAYSWQILETKQRFIANLLSNSLPENSAQDVAEAVLSYAEVKALAVGNPLLRRRIEVANELSKYRVLERKAQDARMYLEQELAELPATIAHRRQLIAFCEQDMAHLAGHAEKPQGQERAVLADKLAAAVERSLPIDPDRELFVYRGFQIVLPRGTDRDKPAVFAGRAGKYYILLGQDPRVYLDFIDRFLADMDTFCGALRVGLSSSERQQVKLREELAKTNNYHTHIESLTEEIARLDKELGVTEQHE